MSEITMLSTMMRAGLLLTFDNTSIGLRLTVQSPRTDTDAVYECNVERGASTLIVRAWRDRQDGIL